MGGEDAGAIDRVDHGMKFWEKQANALRSTLTSRKVVRMDELRRAAEDLGERYDQLEYFQRTTGSAAQCASRKRLLHGRGAGAKDRGGSPEVAMMQHRKFLVALSASVLMAPLGASGQQAGRIAVIGYLSPVVPQNNSDFRLEAFRRGMRERGYEEGKDYRLELRWGEGSSSACPRSPLSW